MKPNLFLAIALCSSIGITQAKQPTSQQPVVHDLVYESCHFTMTDPYGGRLTLSTGGGNTANYHADINPKAQRLFDTWIRFYCEKQKADDAFFEMDMKRSGKNWVLAKEKYQPTPEEHATIYQLHNPKWTGALATFDQTFEDPEDRVRHLGFCIASAHQVLCGTSEQVMYLSHPKESTLPQVIKLLEKHRIYRSSSQTDCASGFGHAVMYR